MSLVSLSLWLSLSLSLAVSLSLCLSRCLSLFPQSVSLLLLLHELVEELVDQETPLRRDLDRLRRLDVDDPDLFQKYRSIMIDRIKREGRIAPGVLRAGDDLVRDGDTLCCACAAPDALAGKCHRHWCARLLVEAGWEVEQDGRRILKEFLM